MCVCAHTVYVCLCGYVPLSSVCLCVRDLSDTHPLYERHITLQLTLLDGDGPFNYSTLMQSAVNTLNQAAKEEAAYPSSLPLSPSLFFALTLFISFPSLSSLPLICFISVCLYLSLHFFFNLLSCFSPFATSICKYDMQTLPSLLTAPTLNSTDLVFSPFFTILPAAHLYQPRLLSALTLAGHKSQTKPA